jgi:hypothetical protein
MIDSSRADTAFPPGALKGLSLRLALRTLSPWRSFRRGSALRLPLPAEGGALSVHLAPHLARRCAQLEQGLELVLRARGSSLVLFDSQLGAVTPGTLALARELSAWLSAHAIVAESGERV